MNLFNFLEVWTIFCKENLIVHRSMQIKLFYEDKFKLSVKLSLDCSCFNLYKERLLK